MKSQSFVLAAMLIIPAIVSAADAVYIDIYLAGNLQQAVSLTGPNSTVKFSPSGLPDTTLELRLIAPEPVIVDMKETSNNGTVAEVIGRISIPTRGGSFAVTEIKGAKFHNPYVLVRRD